VPYVLGRLRKEDLSFVITSECAHCSAPLHIEIDSNLNYRLVEQDAEPVLSIPMVDIGKLEDPSIIDAF
jgi:hypothetical protein